ncbi:MAG TPA: MarC family protein [Candidatus Syntrophoarchaeum butanivorans]|uniref:UPF0056 membrane protein n=1 Tax=Candidatus Syntropharchaeum butanivorans TaxID=1839936 RepID=A0A1F2P5D8_9EURY|nr:MAG: Multiple antibiotic resistance (MarC)-related protein [Candidatus Syntrophoarchaeum butanivorans]HEC57036.1 MarC family protein [Candidatus Syntrophoarchaeum butanivorans]
MFFHALVAVFVIADPFGNLPIFLALTEGLDRATRRKIIIKAVFVATITLIVFGLIGEGILDLLGISISSFRIAGGILLLIIALQMLLGIPRPEVEPEEWEGIAVVPMAIPLLSGPGTITSVMIFMSAAATLVERVHVIAAILIAMLGVGAILVNADLFYEIIKKEGSVYITKIMGIILAAIGTEMIIIGIKSVFLPS